MFRINTPFFDPAAQRATGPNRPQNPLPPSLSVASGPRPGPERGPFGAMATTSDLCKRLLQSATDATITSVCEREGDTIVKLQVAEGSESSVLARMRAAWPLCTASLVENVVEGRAEPALFVPNRTDRRHAAALIARRDPVVRWLDRIMAAHAALMLVAFVCKLVAKLAEEQ